MDAAEEMESVSPLSVDMLAESTKMVISPKSPAGSVSAKSMGMR